MWVMGMVTSLLTATYMFRLVFLTFHGERRHDAPAAPAHPEEEEPVAHGHGHDLPAHSSHGPVASGFIRKDDAHDLPPRGGTHAAHGHGAHGHDPHEAPWSMAIPLILLAIGSIFAGYVGVPHALHGSNRIEAFLEPAFEAHGATHEAAAAAETPGAAEAAGEESHADTGTELQLMILSSGVALAGIGIAAFFWLRNRTAVDGIARSFGGVHRLLLGKYYVDEIYNGAVVQPIKMLSTAGLWKGVDAGLIDGTVNGVGAMISGSSSALRRTQTGSVRTYAFALFAGAVAILGYYLFR
jgi:NADH-quinone oxidoreductase subunit L